MVKRITSGLLATLFTASSFLSGCGEHISDSERLEVYTQRHDEYKNRFEYHVKAANDFLPVSYSDGFIDADEQNILYSHLNIAKKTGDDFNKNNEHLALEETAEKLELSYDNLTQLAFLKANLHGHDKSVPSLETYLNGKDIKVKVERVYSQEEKDLGRGVEDLLDVLSN